MHGAHKSITTIQRSSTQRICGMGDRSSYGIYAEVAIQGVNSRNSTSWSLEFSQLQGVYCWSLANSALEFAQNFQKFAKLCWQIFMMGMPAILPKVQSNTSTLFKTFWIVMWRLFGFQKCFSISKQLEEMSRVEYTRKHRGLWVVPLAPEKKLSLLSAWKKT